MDTTPATTVTITVERDLLAEAWIALRERQIRLAGEVAMHEMETVRAIASEQLVRVTAIMATIQERLGLGG
jgi:hypothetical protein